MEILKKLYSVTLSEDELSMFSEFCEQRGYSYTGTRYDTTDQYKQMKDSDILAEKKKSNTGSYLKAASTGLKGAAIGAGLGLAANAFTKGRAGGFTGAVKSIMSGSGAKTGAMIGGITGTVGGLISTHQERADNRFANDRLDAAKRQSQRRERKDWKNNITNREGYTY